MIKALSKHRAKYIGLFILIAISFAAYYAQEEYEASITEHSTKTIEVIVNESIYVAKSTPSSNSYTKIISNKGGMYKMPLNEINIFNKGDILSLNLPIGFSGTTKGLIPVVSFSIISRSTELKR